MHSDSYSPLIVNPVQEHVPLHPNFAVLSRLMIPHELMVQAEETPPVNRHSAFLNSLTAALQQNDTEVAPTPVPPPNNANIYADLSLPYVNLQASHHHVRTNQLIPIDGVIIRNNDFVCRITLSNVPSSYITENKDLMDTLQLSNPGVRKYCYHGKYQETEVTRGIYKMPHFDEFYAVIRKVNAEITEEQFADYLRNGNSLIPLIEVADFVIDREGLIKTFATHTESESSTHGTLHFHFTAEDVEHNLPILQDLINRL